MLDHVQSVAAQIPSAPLGPFLDSLISWATWTSLTGLVGLLIFSRYVAEPVARRMSGLVHFDVRRRTTIAATVCAAVAPVAILTNRARSAADSEGFDVAAAIGTLFSDERSGWMPDVGLICALSAVVAMCTVLALRPYRIERRLTAIALVTASIALAASRLPAGIPAGEKAVSAVTWMLHLFGASVWVGGLAGIVLLLIPGAVPRTSRAAFWGPALSRFTFAAMASVFAVLVSGIYLYWQRVDGVEQLFTTTFGRVLAVKIALVAVMLGVGGLNQMWFSPRLSAAGVSLRQSLVRRFAIVVATELMLGLTVLLVAPFLHGSARNEAFQAEAALRAPAEMTELPKIEPKKATPTTWMYFGVEALAIIGAIAVGHAVAGRVTRRDKTVVAAKHRAPAMVR